ncbi:MAG: hypothetical protein ACRCX2_17220, partial [Paraclostridium sp.]
TPYADPKLPVIAVEGYAPEGLDIVSNVSIAVGINTDGFLVPCDGTVVPYGIIAHPLLGTACMYAADGRTIKNGMAGMTGTETLHQLIPTVYQGHTLFENGLAYKKDGGTKALFEYKTGDLLRPITKEEIETAIADETLPILFDGESKVICPKTKAMYAGTMVKFDSEVDKAEMKCARAAQFRNPAIYNNYAYAGHFAHGYELQGPATQGLSRAVYSMIGPVLGNDLYEVKIAEYYVTM